MAINTHKKVTVDNLACGIMGWCIQIKTSDRHLLIIHICDLVFYFKKFIRFSASNKLNLQTQETKEPISRSPRLKLTHFSFFS